MVASFVFVLDCWVRFWSPAAVRWHRDAQYSSFGRSDVAVHSVAVHSRSFDGAAKPPSTTA